MTGGGTDECYGGPVSLHVRVSQNGTDWSGWATTDVMIGDPPSGTHPTPTFSAPPLTSIPYTATTPFALTVMSTQVFTSWEYKQACWDADGDPVTVTGNTWPASPTSLGLDETVTWSITTGGEDNQCFSRPRTNKVVLSVRIKSATTDWSPWAVHQLNIALSPTAPTVSEVSHDNNNEVVYGETETVSARVEHSLGFTNVQRYASCRNRGGELVVSDKQEDEQTDTEWVIPVFRDWDVTTGDDTDDCYHTASAALFARVLTTSGWSRWASESAPIAAPCLRYRPDSRHKLSW